MNPWNQTLRWISVLALSVGWSRAAADAAETCTHTLRAYSAVYVMDRDNKRLGTSRALLEALPDGQWRYSIRSEAEKGLAGFLGANVDEVSEFALQEGRLRPQRYQYRQKVSLSKRNRRIDFDWEQGRAEGDEGKDPWSISVAGEESDRLVINLRIMLDLADPQSVLEYLEVDKGEIEPKRFVRGESRTMDTPAGSFEAVEVTRIHRNPKRRTLSYHAAELDFLPIRIEQHKPDGEVLVMDLERVEWTGPQLEARCRN